MNIKNLISLRDEKLHLSALMLMHITFSVRSRTGSIYISELYHYYNQKGGKKYSVQGIQYMCRTLEKRGYMYSECHGRYKAYALTNKGIAVIQKVK